MRRSCAADAGVLSSIWGGGSSHQRVETMFGMHPICFALYRASSFPRNERRKLRHLYGWKAGLCGDRGHHVYFNALSEWRHARRTTVRVADRVVSRCFSLWWDFFGPCSDTAKAVAKACATGLHV